MCWRHRARACAQVAHPLNPASKKRQMALFRFRATAQRSLESPDQPHRFSIACFVDLGNPPALNALPMTADN